jgi:hypothetical protein
MIYIKNLVFLRLGVPDDRRFQDTQDTTHNPKLNKYTRKQTKLNITLAAAGFALVASTANAAVIFSEDWQSPSIANDTQLTSVDNGGLTGWEFQGASNIYRLRHQGDTPQDGLSPNQALNFEWGNSYAAYDTTQTWSSADAYQVTMNATENNWSNASVRTIGIRIREVETNTVLYTAQLDLAEYDAAHAGTGDFWAANQFLTFDFDAGDFAGGTEGNTLEFGVTNIDNTGGPDNRGASVDNITFSLANPIPEPATTALLGLGGLALILRRRK